jgi:hypothetical protein
VLTAQQGDAAAAAVAADVAAAPTDVSAWTPKGLTVVVAAGPACAAWAGAILHNAP